MKCMHTKFDGCGLNSFGYFSFSFAKKMAKFSLDMPLPLNRDGKGLGTQAVKMCTFMQRNLHEVFTDNIKI